MHRLFKSGSVLSVPCTGCLKERKANTGVVKSQMVRKILRSYDWISLDSPMPIPVKMSQQITQLTTLLSSSWRRSRTSAKRRPMQHGQTFTVVLLSLSTSSHQSPRGPVTKEEAVKLLRGRLVKHVTSTQCRCTSLSDRRTHSLPSSPWFSINPWATVSSWTLSRIRPPHHF